MNNSQNQANPNIAENYSALLSQIQLHAVKSGRDPSSIHLVAVTKYASIDQMQTAYKLGIRHFGESRLQSALAKIPHFPKDVVWHFIGSLQSNKLGKILENFDYVHSVDSLDIAKEIGKKSQSEAKLFLQVNTSHEPTKHGFSQDELLMQFDALIGLNLRLVGLMTMAPLTSDRTRVGKCFEILRTLRDGLSYKKRLSELSMGMSQDFSEAIAQGATFLRIGSALFGE